jgi:hypothetical protein
MYLSINQSINQSIYLSIYLCIYLPNYPSIHLSIYLMYLFIYLWLYSPLLDLGCFLSFLVLYTVSRTPWTGDQPVARRLLIHRTTQTKNKRIHTSIPSVGFEPTIPVFERAKTVHALDCSATVIGT